MDEVRAMQAEQGYSPTIAEDFISRPGQPIQRFSPADTVVGAKIFNIDPIVKAIESLNTKFDTAFGGAGGGAGTRAIVTGQEDAFKRNV